MISVYRSALLIFSTILVPLCALSEDNALLHQASLNKETVSQEKSKEWSSFTVTVRAIEAKESGEVTLDPRLTDISLSVFPLHHFVLLLRLLNL